MHLEHVADLVTRRPAQPGRPSHVSAASGLVARGGRLVVAVDDELALATFAPDGTEGEFVPLDGDELPLGHGDRKAAKPDVEALALLPGDVVLALGSGATPARERAWRWPPGGSPEPFDLAPLYAELHDALPDLNLEGAAWADGVLWLAQRGNGAAGADALVRTDLRRVLDVVPVDLGDVGGVPLTLSDLEPLEGGRLGFAASAEDVASTYEDGEIAGAAIGTLDPATGEVLELEVLPLAHKVEGRWGDLLVADADDPARPAPLLRVTR